MSAYNQAIVLDFIARRDNVGDSGAPRWEDAQQPVIIDGEVDPSAPDRAREVAMARFYACDKARSLLNTIQASYAWAVQTDPQGSQQPEATERVTIEPPADAGPVVPDAPVPTP